MPDPSILFYASAPADYTPKLLQLCALQGIRLRIVENADLDRPLSALAQGLKSEKPLSDRAALPEPLLIFCHFSHRQLDRTLGSLRRIRVFCLKAVLTPTNAAWTLRQLYRELCRERSQITGNHRPENDK